MSRTERLPALTTLGLLIVAAIVVAAFGRIGDNMRGFLPTAHSLPQRLLLENLDNGIGARWMLLGIDGGDAQSRAAISHALAEALQNDTSVARVYNAEQEPDAQSAALVYQYRYLLATQDDAADMFSTAALTLALQQRREELLAGGEMIERLVREDPPAASLQWFDDALQQQERRFDHGVWVGEDGALALMTVELAKDSSPQQQAEVLTHIREAFARLDQDKRHGLLLTGTPVIAQASRERIRGDVQRISLLASLAILILLLLIYRSPAAALAATLPMLGGLLAGTATVVAVDGYIHGIALAFGMTLLGVAVDYPMHLFGHRHPDGGLLQSARAIWPALAAGALTTALAYAAFIGTDLAGLQQLGVFNIAGLLAAAAITRWLLPLLPLRPRTPSVPSRLVVVLLRGWRWLPLLPALPVMVYLATQRTTLWQDDIAALSPLSAEQLAVDHRLREAANGADAGFMLAVSGDDAQQVLQREQQLLSRLKQLQSDGVLQGFQMASQLLPATQQQLQRQAALPDAATLRDNLAQAANASGFRLAVFEPFLQAVEQSRVLPPLTPAMLDDTDLGRQLSLLLREWNDMTVGYVLLHGVRDATAVQQMFAQQSLTGVLPVNYREVTTGMMRHFRESALYRLLFGAGLIVVLLCVFLRKPQTVVWLLSNVLAALLCTAAITLAVGAKLSMFHLIALLLVAGIGVDYGLFISRPVQDAAELQRTLASIGVCALSTMLVFGILASSQVPLLRAMGTTVLIGTLITFALTLLGARAPASSAQRGEHT